MLCGSAALWYGLAHSPAPHLSQFLSSQFECCSALLQCVTGLPAPPAFVRVLVWHVCLACCCVLGGCAVRGWLADPARPVPLVPV